MDVSKLARNVAIGQILFIILIIFYIRNVRSYLQGLQSCSCVPLNYVNNIYFYETIFLYIQYVGLLVAIINVAFPKFISKKIIYLNPQLAYMGYTLYSFAVMIMAGLFVYNVYEFHKNLGEDCKCSNKIQKELIYVQGVFYGFCIFLLTLTILLGTLFLARSRYLISKYA